MSSNDTQSNTGSDGFTLVKSRRSTQNNRGRGDARTGRPDNRDRSNYSTGGNGGNNNGGRRPDRRTPTSSVHTTSSQTSRFGVTLPLPLSGVPKLSNEERAVRKKQRERDEVCWFGDVYHIFCQQLINTLEKYLVINQNKRIGDEYCKRMNIIQMIGFAVRDSEVVSGHGEDVVDENDKVLSLPFIPYVSIIQGLEGTENVEALKRYPTRKYKELRNRKFDRNGDELTGDYSADDVWYSFESPIQAIKNALNRENHSQDIQYEVRCYRPSRHFKTREGEFKEGIANKWILEVEWESDPEHDRIVAEYNTKNPAW